jgi:hypothetical protein
VFVLSCVQVEALQRTDYSSKESHHLQKIITELIRGQGPEWAGRATEKKYLEEMFFDKGCL